ncbi:MAG: hypothetical protein O7H41_20110 [Planctomycetota bacterium]|nr:hypothetical protein [Planctomycetota bacterium]
MDSIGIEYLILMYILGFGLLIVELFVPGLVAGSIGLLLISFALIGITAKSTVAGLVVMGFTLVAGFFLLRLAIQRFTLRKSLTRADGYSSAREELKELLGQEGTAATTLRPSGMAIFDGDRVDVVTAGEMVDKDARVKVIEVEGNRVVVKDLDG